MIRTCLNCGQEFTPSNEQETFCSRTCALAFDDEQIDAFDDEQVDEEDTE